MISLIWSMDENWLIGKGNQLPWRIPADLAYFKRITLGHTVIMGRKTFESIGKPLPGRLNVILTKDASFVCEGCKICHSIEEALSLGKEEEIFIIGGAEVYTKFLPYADKFYITKIKGCFEGDAFFPSFEISALKEVYCEKGIRDEKNPYDYFFFVYSKK